MLKRLFVLIMAVAFVMFALPAASDSGGGYAAPDDIYATSGIDTSILEQAVPGALASTVGITPETTLLYVDGGDAKVLTGTGSIWGEFGLYGYCRSVAGGSPLFDIVAAYKHIDPGRTGSAGESLTI